MSYTRSPVFFSKASGYFALGIGVIVVIGCYVPSVAITQIFPSLSPMQYNTALGFILFGTGLVLLTTRLSAISSWLGGVGALFALLTLAEYFCAQNFGIDQLIFKTVTPTEFPGRMPPLTASCFLLIGTALILTWRSSHSIARLSSVGILACIVAMIAFVPLSGYVLGMDFASGLGAGTRMALHTAATFFILTAGLLLWAWFTAREAKIHILRWLPAAASLTLITMIAFVSVASFSRLKKSNFWREHTYEVLAAAQTFLGGLI
jgi:uncharacterized membrane protein